MDGSNSTPLGTDSTRGQVFASSSSIPATEKHTLGKIVDRISSAIKKVLPGKISKGSEIHPSSAPKKTADSQDDAAIKDTAESLKDTAVKTQHHFKGKPKVHKHHKVHVMSPERFKALNQELKLEYDDHEKQLRINNLLESAVGEIDRAKKEKKIITLEDRDIKVFITKQGRVYLGIKELGAGQYKTTFKVIKIAGPHLKHIERVNGFQALSIPKPLPAALSEAAKAGLQAESNNEAVMQKHLHKQSKQMGKEAFSHVVVGKVVSKGAHKTGEAGFLSEFCNGGDVSRAIGSKTLKENEKKNIAIDMCRGVQQLHKAGIVHRDLKPDNFLIDRDDKGNIMRVKVTDMGKCSFISEEGKHKHFMPGQMPLTYMSPDALETEEGRYDPRGDVFQLGISLYQLYCGVRMNDLPFHFEKMSGADFSEKLEKMNQIRDNPQSWPGFKELDPSVQKLLLKMLDHDPDNRIPLDNAIKTLEKMSPEVQLQKCAENPAKVDISAFDARIWNELIPTSENLTILAETASILLERMEKEGNLQQILPGRTLSPEQAMLASRYVNLCQTLQHVASKITGEAERNAFLQSLNLDSRPDHSNISENLKSCSVQLQNNIKLPWVDFHSLQILTKLEENSNRIPAHLISNEDRKAVQEFVQRCVGNMSMNKTLSKMLNAGEISGISEDSITKMRKLSFYTSDMARINQALPKLDRIVALAKAGNLSQLMEDHKLSLEDCGALVDFAAVKNVLQPLLEAGIFSKTDQGPLPQLYSKTSRAGDLYDNLETIVQENLNRSNHYHSGDIQAYVAKKYHKYQGSSPSREDRLKEIFITSYAHGAKIYRAKSDASKPDFSQTRVSEVYSEHEDSSLELAHLAMSEVWRLDTKPLIRQDTPVFSALAKMHAEQGKNPLEEIQKLYHESERFFLEDKKENYKEIANDQKRRYAAGLADFGLKGGHERDTARTDGFSKVHKKFSEGFPKEGDKDIDMICSEFAVKATIAALIETDKRLVSALEEDLKAKGDSESQNLLDKIRKKKERGELVFVRLPYNSKQRLKRIHPGLMVDLLKKEKCISKVSPPPIIQHIFKKESYS